MDRAKPWLIRTTEAPWSIKQTFRNRQLLLLFRKFDTVAIVQEFWIRDNPMNTIEKLARFKKHFDNVFVCVILCSKFGVKMKNKEIHR
jgi:hypothetical protein